MNSDGEDEEGGDNDDEDPHTCSSIVTAIPRHDKKQQPEVTTEEIADTPDNVKEPTEEETVVKEPAAAQDEVEIVEEKPEQAVHEKPKDEQDEPNESARKAMNEEVPEPVPSTSKTADLSDELESKPTMDRHKCRRRCCRPPPHTMSSEHIACLGGRILDTRRPSEPHHHLVWLRFLRLSEEPIPRAVRETLLTADFDSYACADEKVIYLMQQMFFDLGLVDEFPIDLPILKNFLYEVYKHYNQVPFHNFRHCFCVAQMMFAMCMRAQLPGRIGGINVLILLVSCICHDLDHPGFNNIYQINARTELALRYNDISPLENHHCSVAFRILQIHECNIFRNFSQNNVRQIREGIIRCILATDMARHNEILAQFTETAGTEISATNTAHVNLGRQSSEGFSLSGDSTSDEYKMNLCMVLIKVADISNEVRPLNIAEPWLDRLLQEFFAQSDLEKRLGLPVTPFMDRDKVTKPSSQCAFIGLVLLPLFEALAAQLPCLEDILVAPAKAALEHYRRINEHNIKQRSMSTDGEAGPSGVAGRSSVSVDGAAGTDDAGAHPEETPSCSNAADNVIPDTSEAEQENEADVSEKALKFKIATEGSIERRSYPPSRKGSKDVCLSSVELMRALHYAISPSPVTLEEEEQGTPQDGEEKKAPEKSKPAATAPIAVPDDAITIQPQSSGTEVRETYDHSRTRSLDGYESDAAASTSTSSASPQQGSIKSQTSPNRSPQRSLLARLRLLTARMGMPVFREQRQQQQPDVDSSASNSRPGPGANDI